MSNTNKTTGFHLQTSRLPTVYILCGLPGSAKSTWAKKHVLDNPGTKRTNKDDLRLMIDAGQWSNGNEQFILGIRDEIIKEAIRQKKDIIVDDTHCHPKHEQHIETLIGNRAKIVFMFFDVSPEECITRDMQRPNPVGKKVILGMVNGWREQRASLKTKPFEVKIIDHTDHSQACPFKASDSLASATKDPSLPDCLLIDLDGTVALMGGHRGPYDYDKVHNDIVNEPVAEIVRAMRIAKPELKLFVVSGRDAICKQLTENWLTANNIPYDGIFMRAIGDMRKDTVVKEEIYNENFKGKFNVLFALDDRAVVTSHYRRVLGLTVLQCAEGNF